MVNCNPETVSTDYDTSDRLYFEPLTLEDVLAIVDEEKPDGVIVQFGGQTPLKLGGAAGARGREASSARPPTRIDRAEDRERFDALLDEARAAAPARRDRARHRSEAFDGGRAHRLSRCWCGRATCSAAARWRSCTRAASSRATCASAFEALEDAESADHPDRRVPARTRSRSTSTASPTARRVGDRRRACSTSRRPACTPATRPACCRRTRCRPRCSRAIRSSTRALALELGVVGLMNVQFAVRGSAVYVLEVNPRASRTVPFVSQGHRRAAREDRRQGAWRARRSTSSASPRRSSRRTSR